MSGSIIKRVAMKKYEGLRERFKRQPEAVDKDLPYRLKIGSMVKIDPTPFILNDGLEIINPGEELFVKAFGELTISGQKVYRFYLENLETQAEAWLEIVDDEIKLFREVDQVVPYDEDDWGDWLSEEDGFIGNVTFGIDDEVEYTRTWVPDTNRLQVAPIESTETVYLDSYGEKKLSIEHSMMLYNRPVGSTTEYALLSADQENDEALVAISIGIDIDPSTLN